MAQEHEMFRLLHSGGNETEFVVCGNAVDSPWFYLGWNLGRPLETIEEPVLYTTDTNLPLEDYPWGNAMQFIASPKLLSLIKESGARFDVYRSLIRFPNGRVVDDYVTINFTQAYSVVDRTRSTYSLDPDFPDTKIYEIEKLTLSRAMLPTARIFLMAEEISWLLVARELKEEIEASGVTGVAFEPVAVL